MPESFISYVSKIVENGSTQGDGEFSNLCVDLISKISGGGRVLLTPSCTHALEMSTLLLNLQPNDEVIMPSFTFTSAAVALANYGVIPVFVDIDPKTKNLDPDGLKRALTPKTRAISLVNYAGVACDYPEIIKFITEYNLRIIEDNAHGIFGEAFDKPLGSFGSVSSLSFHESKNFQSGEGGALVINDSSLIERAEVLREKGTNRNKFLRGQIDKYTWVDLGSSQLMSEVSAALLLSQLEMGDKIQDSRLSSWDYLYDGLLQWSISSNFELPFIPEGFSHTAHIFYVVAPSTNIRDRFVAHLRKLGIPALFHYQPLHLAPAGLKYGRVGGESLENTVSISERLLRIPIYFGMGPEILSRIISAVTSFER